MPIAKRWSDFDLDFTKHPTTGELSMKRDDDAVVRSIQYLLLTNHYERPFNPEIGSHLRGRLFDPMSYETSLNIKEDIMQTINNYETRVQLNEIVVEPVYEENGYQITL